MVGIYKIENPNHRIYIGQSTNITLRWSKYFKYRCKDQPSLYNSLKKYGVENHIFEVLEECQPEDLDVREIFWGEKFEVLSNQHLNNRLGRGFGSYDSEETKNKKRVCHLGRKNFWLKNKPLSEEHKEKISISKTGNKQHRIKIRKDKGISRTSHIEAVIKSKSKAIIQCDKFGNFLKEWESGKKASIALSINQPNINSCCNGKYTHYKGFIWRFKIL